MYIYYLRIIIDDEILFDKDHYESNLYLKTVTSFFMWAKMLYFLRIFEEFAYLIRMIIVVI